MAMEAACTDENVVLIYLCAPTHDNAEALARLLHVPVEVIEHVWRCVAAGDQADSADEVTFQVWRARQQTRSEQGVIKGLVV